MNERNQEKKHKNNNEKNWAKSGKKGKLKRKDEEAK